MPEIDYQFNLHLLRERAKEKDNLPGLEAIDRWIERSKGWEREAVLCLVQSLQGLIEDAQQDQWSKEDLLTNALRSIEYFESVKETEALHEESMQRLDLEERLEIAMQRAIIRRDAITLLQLREDLKRETKRAQEHAQKLERIAPKTLDPEAEEMFKLADRLKSRFNDEDLRTLCFRLAFDYDNLARKTKDGRIEELVNHYYRRRKLSTLEEKISQVRPDITFE